MCFENIGLLSRIGEYKISVLFAISVLPAVLLNLDSDFEIIVRAFCSVSFVPLAFVLGGIICVQIKNADKMLLYNILLLLPMFSVTAMMQSMPMLIVGTDFGRDAILAVSIFLPLILATKGKCLKGILLILLRIGVLFLQTYSFFMCRTGFSISILIKHVEYNYKESL